MADAADSAISHDMNSGERWLPVLGYEGFYEVSDRGRVRSLPRVTERIGRRGKSSLLRFPGKLLKTPPFGKAGHVGVNLYENGKGSTFQVHRLVLDAFVGPRPDGMECRHLDGNPANNRLENLAWGTRAENMADRTRLGEHNPPLGEQRANAVLTEADVRKIRRLHDEGMGGSAIARSLGININTTFSVIHRRCWKWLK